MIYVLGGSLTLRYRDKGNLLINGRHRKDYGDAPCAPPRLRWGGAAGAHRDGRATIPCGGSRGPLDPWSASTASKRWDLWFFRSRKNDITTRCCQSPDDQVLASTKRKGKNSTESVLQRRGSAGALAPANKVIAFRFDTAPAVRRRCGAGRRCRSRCAGCLCRLCTPHAPHSR